MQLKRANRKEEAETKISRTVPISDIEDKVKEVDRIDAEIRRLKDLRAKTKEEIAEMIFLVDASGNELEEFIFNAYWFMEHINATSLRSMLKQRTGDDKNWRAIVSAEASVICSLCGTEYTKVYKSRQSFNEDKARSRYPALVCPECEQKKARSRAENRQEIEDEFHKEVARLRAMSYSEYLNTDHWNEVRNRALKRSRFMCQLCSSGGTLHVHHRTYENLGNERNDDLIVLCKDCHAKFHDKIPE